MFEKPVRYFGFIDRYRAVLLFQKVLDTIPNLRHSLFYIIQKGDVYSDQA